jgi:hypothetical protein
LVRRGRDSVYDCAQGFVDKTPASVHEICFGVDYDRHVVVLVLQIRPQLVEDLGRRKQVFRRTEESNHLEGSRLFENQNGMSSGWGVLTTRLLRG